MANEMRPGLRLVDRGVLVVAWLVTCGLVYALGFYTGKGTQERRFGMEERVVRLPVQSEVPPAGGGAKAAPDYEFYGNLVAGDRGLEPGPAAPIAAPGPSAAAVPARATSSAVGAPVPSTVAPREAAPPPAPAPRPSSAATASAPARPASAAPPRPGTEGRAATPPGSTVAPTGDGVARAEPARPAAATRPEPTARARGWTVRTRPTASRTEAESLQASLRSRGYDAQIVQARRDGAASYVLVVGRYATAAQASETMRRLRERDGIAQAFVASE